MPGGEGFWVPTSTGSGGGLTWTQYGDYDGSSFAAFTSGDGTWASDGTVISQTDTGASDFFAYPTTDPGVALVGTVVEFEFRFPVDGSFVGVVPLMHTSLPGDRPLVRLNRSGGTVEFLTGGSVSVSTTTPAVGSWATLRVAYLNGVISCWLDGSHVGSVVAGGMGLQRASRFALFVRSASVQFRNIKAWTLDPSMLPT